MLLINEVCKLPGAAVPAQQLLKLYERVPARVWPLIETHWKEAHCSLEAARRIGQLAGAQGLSHAQKQQLFAGSPGLRARLSLLGKRQKKALRKARRRWAQD